MWRGHIADVLRPGLFDPDRVAAGIWWPRDRQWFVTTEIDFAWTFVAGKSELIDRLVTNRDLEAVRTAFEAGANQVSDKVGQ